MCSRETNSSSNSSSSADDFQKSIIMGLGNNNRRCTTLSDNITFRHRHRRYSFEDNDLLCGRSKRSKLKCCGKDNKNLSLLKHDGKTLSNQQVNSNRLISSRNKNFQLVILANSALMLSIMVQPVSAFNVDVGSKVVHSAPRSTCYDDCMFGFSVAEHKEKGQPW